MKYIMTIGIITVILIAVTSIWGRAAYNTAADTIKNSTPVEFDVQVAKTAVNDLRHELIQDGRNLTALNRDIARTRTEINDIKARIDSLAEQITAGSRRLANNDYTVNGFTFSATEIETQISAYIAQRESSRNILRTKEQHLVRLRQKYAEMESMIAQKRLTVENYESQVAMLDIEARFQSNIDRYNVSTGNTEVQDIINRLSDKISVNSPTASTNIDFVGRTVDLEQQIANELSH